jgi:hypothetical protein
MASSQPLTELVHAAQSAAKTSLDRISEILDRAEGETLTDAQIKEIASETVAVELVAVDIFTVFEARMQRHFKRGPLSRKVEAALLTAGHADAADRLHQYYLAINVLKHGHGASHRELLNTKSAMLVVTQDDDLDDERAKTQGEPTGLIDVTAPPFFDGLAATILYAYAFLEGRQG